MKALVTINVIVMLLAALLLFWLNYPKDKEDKAPEPIFAPHFELLADGMIHSIPESDSPPWPPAWAWQERKIVYHCPPLANGSYTFTAYAGKEGVFFYTFYAIGGETQFVVYVGPGVVLRDPELGWRSGGHWPIGVDMSVYENFKRWDRGGIKVQEQ